MMGLSGPIRVIFSPPCYFPCFQGNSGEDQRRSIADLTPPHARRDGARDMASHPATTRAPGASSALVPDAVDGAGEVVRDQDRSVGELRHVHRPAEIFAVLGEPAVGEHLGLVRRAVLLE